MAADNVASPISPDAENQASSVTPEVMAALVEALSGANRRRRQEASHTIALVAAFSIAGCAASGVTNESSQSQSPEAQTRWEVLSTLSELALVDAGMVEEAFDGAEASLFDEDSAIVRLAAFRFLIRLGASSPERSDKVWGIVDEAIQCYHGDPEYRDMLVALSEFGKGSISETTRDALLTRIGFDADNGRGYVRIMSAEIVANIKGA